MAALVWQIVVRDCSMYQEVASAEDKMWQSIKLVQLGLRESRQGGADNADQDDIAI